MKRYLLLSLLLAATLVTGCAYRYNVQMRNGAVITSKGKPKLDERGNYVFTDVEGNPRQIYQGLVREISPASDTSSSNSKDKKSFFSPSK